MLGLLFLQQEHIKQFSGIGFPPFSLYIDIIYQRKSGYYGAKIRIYDIITIICLCCEFYWIAKERNLLYERIERTIFGS